MPRAFAPRLAVVLGYVLATIAFSWPLPLHLGTHFTGDPGGDTGVYVWNQWVFYQELIAGHNPLHTEKILALSTPAVDLTQHNYTTFSNVLALPFMNWLGVVATFNVVFLIICVLNSIMIYGLIRRVTAATRWEAWLAGLAFAWSPAMVARTTGHFSLAAAAAIPAFMWALINAERSRSTRDAVLVGLCMAWAGLSDAYYGIYCLMIGVVYVTASAFRVTAGDRHAPRVCCVWVVDVLLVCVGGLIAGLVLGHGGDFSLFGVPVHVRSLYTPVLLLTILVIVRAILWWRPQFEVPSWRALPVKMLLIAALACAGPLAPVLYGLGERVAEGRFVNPDIFWRSSPRGVDLLAFVHPNPQHPLVRWLTVDPLVLQPTVFVEYTASLSLVAVAIIIIAMWRAGFRPRPAWIAVTLGFALLALGPFLIIGGANTHVPGPWALLRYVPGFALARTPTRFVVVASMGLSILMAGGLASLGERWPHRRRQIGAVVGLLLLFELCPAPRPLYSAEISPIYDRIAADPRPVRVLSLPFGVRDGTWETGNFRPRTQFNQTRHGKALIGGYLSRVSQRRVERMRVEYPTLDALIKLSDTAPIGPEVKQVLDDRGDRLIAQGDVGYVVIDQRFIPAARAQLVIDALKLREVQRDRHLTLYVPAANLP